MKLSGLISKSLNLIFLIGFFSTVNFGDGAFQSSSTPLLPGLDFVGCGFDLRYERPVDAMRFCLLQMNFVNNKTFIYDNIGEKLNFTYPDEVFVRLVETAEATNSAFDDMKTAQTRWLLDFGIDYNSLVNGTEPTPLPDTNTTALTNNGTVNGTGGANLTSIYQKAGYDQNSLTPEGLLKARTEEVTLKALKLSAYVDFLQRTVENSENWVVINKQYHKLWHIYMDSLLLKQGFANELGFLQGKTVINDPELFAAFFEKYGTHYIHSAIMGGAMELTTIVDTVADTETTNVTVDLLASYNVTSNTTNITSTNAITENSPNCTGSRAGYAYNSVSQQCVPPIQLSCQRPLWNETFDNLAVWNSTWTQGPYPCPTNVDPMICSSCCVMIRRSCCVQNTTCNCRYGPAIPYSGPTFRPSGLAGYTVPVAEQACGDCNGYFFINGSSQQFNKHMVGAFGKTDAVYKPQLITVNIRASSLGGGPTPNQPQWMSNIVIVDEGVSATKDDDKILLAFGMKRMNGSTTAAAMCLFAPDFAERTQQCSGPIFLMNTWYKISFKVDWTTQKMELWVSNKNTGQGIYFDPVRILVNVPFYDSRVTGVSKIDLYGFSGYTTWSLYDSLFFCNGAQQGAVTAVTEETAVATSTAHFRQQFLGRIDFQFFTSNSKTSFRQTYQSKLRGGDTSKVDLLSVDKKVESIQAWKRTIAKNPAPVVFTLKPISSLIPSTLFNGINMREQFEIATQYFLSDLESTQIPINASPDDKAPNFVNPN